MPQPLMQSAVEWKSGVISGCILETRSRGLSVAMLISRPAIPSDCERNLCHDRKALFLSRRGETGPLTIV
jgi:hypothetical protein